MTKDFDNILLPTYIINLQERTDRREHILSEFKNKPEFYLNIIKVTKHKIGAVGLWESILKCVQAGMDNGEDFIIICEDDHMFTSDYQRDFLIQNIIEAHEQNCDVLCGGIGGFGHGVPITSYRYWVNHFWCTQFIVIYRKFFIAALDQPYDDTVTADDKLSEMTCHKMVLYPFISVQKDFGYSDVTKFNNDQIGRINNLFKQSGDRLSTYRRIYEEYIAPC